MTAAQAVDYAHDGITSVAIHPGLLITDMSVEVSGVYEKIPNFAITPEFSASKQLEVCISFFTFFLKVLLMLSITL